MEIIGSKEFKHAIEQSLNLKDYQNLFIIQADYNVGMGDRGISWALSLAIKYPLHNILLISSNDLESLLEEKSILALFLKLENAFFAQLGPNLKLPNLLKKDYKLNENLLFNKRILALRELLLNANLLSNKIYPLGDELDQGLLDQMEEDMKILKYYFPEFREIDDMKIFSRALSRICGNLPITTKQGVELPGVFCSLQVFLSKDNEMLSLIQYWLSNNLPVTLWTERDMRASKAILEDLNIFYPLKKKKIFAGTQPEVVVDVEPLEVFIAKTGIYPVKYYQVK